jgi:hypothetical protein
MAGVIPDTGSISLGGTDERSVAALRNIKNTSGNTTMIHMSAMRDWSDEFLGSGKPAGFPSGDEVSLGDWRGASIFGCSIKIQTETDSTYDDLADGVVRVAGRAGSGLYEFQLVQDTGSSSANYVDTNRGIDVEAVSPGTEGNDITLANSGGSTAASLDDDLVVIDLVSLEAAVVGVAYNITLTGNGSSSLTELLDGTQGQNQGVDAGDYNITSGSSFILMVNETIAITGGTAGSKSSFSGNKNIVKLITAQRTGNNREVDVTVTGNGVNTVQQRFASAGISVNIEAGANEILATSGYGGAANDMVLTGGSAGVTVANAAAAWNLADSGGNQVTVHSGGAVNMGTGEVIVLAGGTAGYDQTKTTSSDTDHVVFAGLGGSVQYSQNYYYILTVTDRSTSDSFSVRILVGIGNTGVNSRNAVFTNPSPHIQIGTDDSDPDSYYFDAYAVYSGPEDGNTGGVAYGN